MKDDLAHLWRGFTLDLTEARFVPLYQATKSLVWSICRRILRNDEDAADAFQSTYCRLLAEAQGSSAYLEDEAVQRLVYRLSIREAQSLRERRTRRGAKEFTVDDLSDKPGGDDSPAEAASERQLRDQIETLLATLPDRYRLPVLLHFYQGMSYREIAESLSLPKSTVASRVSRGLKRLRPLMRKAGIRDSLASLGAIAAAPTMLSAPSALGASVVFTKAQAAVAAGLAVVTMAPAGGMLLSESVVSAAGAALLKLKLAAVPLLGLAGAAVVAMLGATLLQGEKKRPVTPAVQAAPADAAVNPRDQWGISALHWAAGKGELDKVKQLLAEGADVNVKIPNEGSTPLHWAACNEHPRTREIIEVLLAHGAPIDDRNDLGLTPLTTAVANDHPESARLLLSKGADVNTTSITGETALAIAKRRELDDLEAMVRGYGGRE